MDIHAILGNGMAATSDLQKKPQGPSPLPQQGQAGGDTADFSTEALALQSGSTPDSLKTALTDLKGDRKNLTSDLKAIGDYFSSQPGGVQAMNAFMEANFSREDLETFRQKAETAGLGTPQVAM